jgi:hypothetical protein
LAGFLDADANFQVKILNLRQSIKNKKNIKIKLNFQINHKEKSLLILIQNFIGGNIRYIKSQNIYTYCTDSFSSAKNLINYLDKFSLQSSNRTDYII